MGSVLKILGVLVIVKQRQNVKIFWERCLELSSHRRKRAAFLGAALRSLQQGKVREFLISGFRGLALNGAEMIKKEDELLRAAKVKLKNESAMMMGTQFHKIYACRVKTAL
jgi:hypothetical protein